MITIQDACKLAQKEMKEFRINECIDIGDKYIFTFVFEDEMPPGTPMISVVKRNGKISYFTIPPIQNINILNAGKKIELTNML
jgi:hypothetical protein